MAATPQCTGTLGTDFFHLCRPDDLVWVRAGDGSDGQLPVQWPREIFDAAVLAPSQQTRYTFAYVGATDEQGNPIESGPFEETYTLTPGTYDYPIDVTQVGYDGYPNHTNWRVPTGGDLLSSVAKAVAAVAVVPAAIAVGGASAGNVATNAITGKPLDANAPIAAAVDLGGLAVGSGIAAAGIADAAASGEGVELGTTLAEPAADAGELGTVQSVAVDAAATEPSAGVTLGELAGAAKSIAGTVLTGAGLVKLINPPKAQPAPRPVASPGAPAVPTPVPSSSPACNVCGLGRALLAIAPLAFAAFS